MSISDTSQTPESAALQPGLRSELAWEVTLERTAAAVGHEGVEVFGTPHMGLLAELASGTILQGRLPDGVQHVGTVLEVHHREETPIGFTVTAKAELIEVDGPKLTFRVEMFDDVGYVGHVIHQRWLVEWRRFLDRLEARRARGKGESTGD